MTEPAGLLDEAVFAAEADEARRPGAAEPIVAAQIARIVPERAAPPPADTAYRLALAFVAAVGSLLALLYVAFLAAGCLGLWLHLTRSTVKWAGKKGDFSPVQYAGLTVVLIVLVFLMIRPLFVRPRGDTAAVTVAPGEEPALHAFVERVARAVGAPVPVRIDVDSHVNASAGFRRGLRSFGRDDLVLTIGAPLLAGMSVEQFAGVLAHELGHFRQGAGMRFTFVARTLEAWFVRVVHQRDRFDAWAASYGPVRAAMWCLRKLFAGMLWVLQRAERLASRRMEIDADEHSLALVGGPATVAAMRRLVLLDASHSAALETAQKAYEGGRLPDDLPALVLGWRARMPADVARSIVEGALAERTRAQASHPCMRERIERAADRPAGMLRCDRPARALLRDPERLFRTVTARQFAAVTDGASAGATVVPVSEVLAGADSDRAAREALARWSQGVLSYLVLPRVAGWTADPPPARDAAVAELRAARDELASRAAASRAAVRTFDDADTRVAHAARITAVLEVGGNAAKIPDVATIEDRTSEGARRARTEARAAQRGARVSIDPALAALGRRCGAGLALLDGDAAAEARALVARLAAADAALDAVVTLRERIQVFGNLAREAGERKNKVAVRALSDFVAEVSTDIDGIRAAFAAPAAANAAATGLSPASAPKAGDPPPVPVLPAIDASTAPEAAFEAGSAALGAFYGWWFATATRLAVCAESAETAAGLEPLPPPAD